MHSFTVLAPSTVGRCVFENVFHALRLHRT
jgi:hypothetical protein